jgi:hypothetical protein
MMKNSITLITLLASIFISNAQDITKNGTPNEKKYGFSLGYFGYRFNNVGFQIGVENYLASTNNYVVLGGVNILYYNQKDIQSAVAMNARIGQRYTAGFGLFLESYLGIGLQQTLYVNKTFDYNSGQSTISETKMSKTGIIPNISLGLGYDFSKKTKIPLKFYLRPSIYWLYPDRNLVFQSSYAIETGLIYVPTFKKKQKKGSS